MVFIGPLYWCILLELSVGINSFNSEDTSLNPALSDIVSSSLLNSWNDENLINDTFFKNKNDDFLHYSETRRNEALSFSSEGESKAREIVEKVEKDLQHWTDDLHDGIRIRVNKLTREEIQKLWDNRIKDIRSTWEEVIGTPVLKKKKYISLNPVLSDIVSSSLLNSWNDENLINDTFLNKKKDDALHYSETRRNEALSLSSKGASKAREMIDLVRKDLQQWIDSLYEGIKNSIKGLKLEDIQFLWDNRMKDVRRKWEEAIKTPEKKY